MGIFPSPYFVNLCGSVKARNNGGKENAGPPIAVDGGGGFGYP